MKRLFLLASFACFAGVITVAGFGWFEQRRQITQAAPYVTSDLAKLPTFEVGMVLGTGPLTFWRDGRVTPNIPFVYRLDAAAALWRADKVKYLIASGNRRGEYDEPTAIRAGLIERGVPASVIYRDFAGYRTNDSVRRARAIFGLKRLVIVSQAAHVERAVLLARAVGIAAWGFEAREEGTGGPRLTERIALMVVALRAWWDMKVDTPAREGGPPIVIGVDPPN